MADFLEFPGPGVSKDDAIDLFLRCYDFMIDGGLPDDLDTAGRVLACCIALDGYGLAESFDRNSTNARHYIAACIALGMWLEVVAAERIDRGPFSLGLAGACRMMADRLSRVGCQLAGLPAPL